MNLKKALKPYVPPRVAAFPYVVAFRFREWRRHFFHPDPLDPPERAGNPGRGEFEAVGRQFFELFVAAGLGPGDRVLEIGCSIGRMALPLTTYLVPPGRYDGIDISKRSIRWCRHAIGRRARHFRFHHADVRNGEYNPRGSIDAADYRLPFDAASFDFVFLTSVFTHMLPPEVRRYLAEISRVLAPEGRALMTLFLLGRAAPSPGELRFDHRGEGYRTVNARVPEEAVAYDEADVRRWLSDAGLAVVDPIRSGSWSGAPAAVSYQDVVVAKCL